MGRGELERKKWNVLCGKYEVATVAESSRYLSLGSVIRDCTHLGLDVAIAARPCGLKRLFKLLSLLQELSVRTAHLGTFSLS